MPRNSGDDARKRRVADGSRPAAHIAVPSRRNMFRDGKIVANVTTAPRAREFRGIAAQRSRVNHIVVTSGDWSPRRFGGIRGALRMRMILMVTAAAALAASVSANAADL